MFSLVSFYTHRSASLKITYVPPVYLRIGSDNRLFYLNGVDTLSMIHCITYKKLFECLTYPYGAMLLYQ